MPRKDLAQIFLFADEDIVGTDDIGRGAVGNVNCGRLTGSHYAPRRFMTGQVGRRADANGSVRCEQPVAETIRSRFPRRRSKQVVPQANPNRAISAGDGSALAHTYLEKKMTGLAGRS